MSKKLLRAVEERLARAEAQTTDVISEVKRWSAHVRPTTSGQLLQGRLGFEIRLDGFGGNSFDKFSLPTGECLFNLRATMDNLAFALARLQKDPPDAPAAIYYPTCIVDTDFDTRSRKLLAQLPPAVVAAMRLVQPFQRQGRIVGDKNEGHPSDDPGVLLHRINISDKHRVPLAATLVPTELDFSGGAQFETEQGASDSMPPDIELILPLSEGAVFFRWRTKAPLASVAQHFDIKAKLCILAGDDLVYLESTVASLTNHVRLLVEHFRPFF